MEPQQQTTQQVQQQNEEGNSGKGGGGGGGSYMCRQSSTRWTPTTDQIRILKELYYNNGVRSPSAEQIQRISARLRQYGKIEGKNVFYWFQNHKARERQKKRFISDTHHSPPSFQRSAPSAAAWKPEDPTTAALYHNKFPNITTPGVATACSSSSSSQGVSAVGQMGGFGSYGGGGSVTMEKSFRDCSLSAAAAGGGNGIISQNFGWVGGDPYASPYTSSLYNDKRSNFIMETLEEDDDDDDDDEAPEIETLPLFPIHNEDINGRFCNVKPSPDGYYSTGWYRSDDGYGPSRTSLELSLSYSGRSHEST